MQTVPRAREGEDALREAIAAFDESGFARVVMDCSGKMNPHRVAHGGAIFSLADHAFGIAANCSGADRVAVSVHIQYIAPATGSLTAIAERVADTGNYSTFRGVVSESTRSVAVFTGVALIICPG